MKIKAILFDCSGTLIDDFDAVYGANMETLKFFGKDSVSKQIFSEKNTSFLEGVRICWIRYVYG